VSAVSAADSDSFGVSLAKNTRQLQVQLPFWSELTRQKQLAEDALRGTEDEFSSRSNNYISQ